MDKAEILKSQVVICLRVCRRPHPSDSLVVDSLVREHFVQINR